MKKNSATSAAVPTTNKKEAEAVPTAMKMRAAKRRRSDGTAGRRALKRPCDLPKLTQGDLISSLPDAILEAIISLLPIKDGVRTQAVARGWRPLWRSAPLDLDATDICSNKYKRISVISGILRNHLGPARRFTFENICLHKSKKGYAKDDAEVERWFHSRCLDNLEELDISFRLLGKAGVSRNRYPLPSSVLRLAPTLVVAGIGVCRFPSEIARCVNFPLLRQLTLWSISISEEALHVLLSACHVLETLFLEDIRDVDCLRVSSPTLKIIWFSATHLGRQELVIEDVPHLERLLCPALDGETIRVHKAPKLKILGPLSPHVSKIEIANLILQETMPPSSLSHSICTVNILALKFAGPDLNAVLNILRCFPCLEKLYVIWDETLKVEMIDMHQYEPLNPIKCLESHLKVLVLNNYIGDEEDIGFAKFFVSNAKVVKEIKFGVSNEIGNDRKWMSNQKSRC
ncbi:putative FBD-associated F-box protein At5g22720 [Triticum aestivum]|uniref:putative FBD-associated F-box protein At5g22720 n=1 Tax=Triticum aestivum TaxID=4565 RepID=UPI001D010756|nr:putative FBD-associated F-box protein At5g22720 [Triticum aestivum]